MKTYFRFRTAPNGPWVYFRLEADDGLPITLEDATQFVMDRLGKSSPWIFVQQVSLREATFEEMPPWLVGLIADMPNARIDPAPLKHTLQMKS